MYIYYETAIIDPLPAKTDLISAPFYAIWIIILFSLYHQLAPNNCIFV